MKHSIIRTKALGKTYVSDGIEFAALSNINLEIYEKEFTVIMGSSGSGKSTLLYLLSGLDTITSGEVYFQEQRIDRLDEKNTANFRRRSIGFVFQAINLVPNLSLLENVAIAGYLLPGQRYLVNQRATQLLQQMDLSAQAGRLPAQVSGGQQQRAAIARSLINSPTVLFADEPTGALNSSQGQAVLDVLSEINAQGQTIVMVTHDLKAACRADRILFIRDGQIDGDLALEPYNAAEASQRELTVFNYLNGKGW